MLTPLKAITVAKNLPVAIFNLRTLCCMGLVTALEVFSSALGTCSCQTPKGCDSSLPQLWAGGWRKKPTY